MQLQMAGNYIGRSLSGYCTPGTSLILHLVLVVGMLGSSHAWKTPYPQIASK